MNRKKNEIDITNESEDPFEFLLSVTRNYGDAIQYRGPHGSTFLFNHPEYIRQVLQSAQFQRTTLIKIVLGEGLLASDGDYWARQRRLALPFFQHSAVVKFERQILFHTHAMLERWVDFSDKEKSLDISVEMTQLTLTIIIEVLFGIKLGSQMLDLGEALDVLLKDLGDMGCSQLNTPLTFTPSSRERFQTALSTLDQIVYQIIEEKRRMHVDPSNFLSFLLTVRDEKSGAQLTNRQIRDEVVTMMIAGHETTALILTWAWSLLASNPDIEQSLHHELDQVLGVRKPGISDLEKLPYGLQILRESMRLYPPVWFIARRSAYAGDINGYHVPENVLVIVSPFAIHRHPGFWKNPDEFDVLRFTPGTQQTKYSYIPFGGGRHLCLGMHLALFEGHLILSSIAQKYSLQPVSNHVVQPIPAITLRLRDGLMAIPRKRIP